MALFGSSNPFGASSSTPFGGTATSPNPFGTTIQNNPFGGNRATNPFGANPFGSTPFGGQSGSSLFGSGTATGMFGATQPTAFGGTTSTFGAASATPTFGTSGAPFGSGTPTGVFGQKPPTSFGGFGTNPAQVNPFGTPFGQSQSSFGSSNLPTFGATSTPTPAFGSSTTPAFGSSTPAFASSTPAFATSASIPFGSSTPAFGSSTVFGQSPPVFGGSSSPAFGSTLFGSTTGTSFGAPQSGSTFGSTAAPSFGTTAFGTSFGGQRVGSRVAAYTVTNDTDVGVSGQVGKFMSISAMPAYNSKSPEELRWEDYQANDKGGLNTMSQQSPAPGGIFGQAPAQSPFGASTGGFGQTTSTPNPFASMSSTTFGATSTSAFGTSAFGTSSTPAFGQGFSLPQSPFSGQSTLSAFGQASTPAFGATSSPFGSSFGAGFGTSAFGPTPVGTSVFGSNTPGFTGSAFATMSSPTNIGASSPFGTTGFFGQSQPTGNLFGTPSSQGFGASMSSFGASSTPAFANNVFNSGGIFSQTKPAGLTQSSPSPFSSFGQSTQGQASFGFPTFQTSQSAGSSLFNSTLGSAFGQNKFAQPQVATNQLMAMPQQPVANPFGTLPAMPQISIGHGAGSVPSVQYGISSMPVSDKATQVQKFSLLTPRNITQRSKVRMHVRRYHPKKDIPKVSFFSDVDEIPSTPKADVLFVPRENPRALFIRQGVQPLTASMPSKGTPDSRDIATPLQRNGVEVEDSRATSDLSSFPADHETMTETGSKPDLGEGFLHSPHLSSKLADKVHAVKSVSKVNGIQEEHNHHGNGYNSVTGHRADEHGAGIEALIPKLRHSDYFTEPRIEELAAKERSDPGYCSRVQDFVVGRKAFGSVKFLGNTDVRHLDLEGIIQFNKCEVLVYMDEIKKPPIGKGLNKPAEVTLLNVKCFDKKTGQQYTDGLELDKFEKRLKRKTEEQGADFISYDSFKGEWRFRVKHFSRYGLAFSDNEFLQASSEILIIAGVEKME